MHSIVSIGGHSLQQRRLRCVTGQGDIDHRFTRPGVYFTNTFMIAYTTQQLSLPRSAGTSLVCVQALARRHAVAHGLEMSAAPARAQGQANLILPAYY